MISIFGAVVMLSLFVYVGVIIYLIKYRRELKETDKEHKSSFKMMIALLLVCIMVAMLQYVYFKPIDFVEEGSSIRTIKIDYHTGDGPVTTYRYDETSDLTILLDVMSNWKGRRHLFSSSRTVIEPNIALIGIVMETNKGFEDYAIIVEEHSIRVYSDNEVYTILNSDNGTLSDEVFNVIDGYTED